MRPALCLDRRRCDVLRAMLKGQDTLPESNPVSGLTEAYGHPRVGLTV